MHHSDLERIRSRVAEMTVGAETTLKELMGDEWEKSSDEEKKSMGSSFFQIVKSGDAKFLHPVSKKSGSSTVSAGGTQRYVRKSF